MLNWYTMSTVGQASSGIQWRVRVADWHAKHVLVGRPGHNKVALGGKTDTRTIKNLLKNLLQLAA